MAKHNTADTSPFSSSSSPSSWVRGTCFGRGCFGTVCTAMSKSNGRVFAVKSVDLATCLPVQSESLENEISILRSLQPHPYIVRFLGDDVSKEGTTSYRNLHLEYLPGGTVAVVAAGGVDEGLIRRYAWCLVSALRHVHFHGIVHCDVKGRNVLIGPDPSSVKLADFGSSIKFGKPKGPITPRGSPLWMAPEVIRGEYQGPESDVWSLGCTVLEMFTGKPAWEDRGLDSLSQIAFTDELPRFPTGLSELGRDFLGKCLKRDRRQRWRCDQLLQHPFLSRDSYSLSTESSPRCVLDWSHTGFEEELEERENESGTASKLEPAISAMARICKLAEPGGAIWESDDWVEVRGYTFEDGRTGNECPNSTRANEEIYVDSSEGQSCNVDDDEEVEGVSTVDKRWTSGYRCRYGKWDVGWVLVPCGLLLLKFVVVGNIIRKNSVSGTNIILILDRHPHHNDNKKYAKFIFSYGPQISNLKSQISNLRSQICFVASDSDRAAFNSSWCVRDPVTPPAVVRPNLSNLWSEKV